MLPLTTRCRKPSLDIDGSVTKAEPRREKRIENRESGCLVSSEYARAASIKGERFVSFYLLIDESSPSNSVITGCTDGGLCQGDVT